MAERKTTVTLGGKEFTIQALPMGAARAWRAQFSEPLQTIIGVMRGAGNIELTTTDEAGKEHVDLGIVAGLVQQVGGLLIGSMDILTNALFAYSPELQLDRVWIEQNADDTEAIAALWKVVQLAYPFGSLAELLNRGATTIGRSKK